LSGETLSFQSLEPLHPPLSITSLFPACAAGVPITASTVNAASAAATIRPLMSSSSGIRRDRPYADDR
jgi:hypothetical protein